MTYPNGPRLISVNEGEKSISPEKMSLIRKRAGAIQKQSSGHLRGRCEDAAVEAILLAVGNTTGQQPLEEREIQAVTESLFRIAQARQWSACLEQAMEELG